MLVTWFALSVIVLIMKTVSNPVVENPSDLSLLYSNDTVALPINQSIARCRKSTSCFPLDKSLQYAVNEINKIYFHLENIRIRKKKDGYRVQIKLGLYDDIIKEGNQSLHVKFSFGADSTCYQFSIPPSVLMNNEDKLLSCFRIPVLQRDLFVYVVHKETDKVISFQALYYSLSHVAVGQWLGGSLLRITYDLDHKFIYFSLNATQGLKCALSYNISVYESDEKHPCSQNQIPVYRWSDALTSRYHRLNVSQSLLSPSQKYCLYAIFTKFQHCGTLQSENLHYFSFFELMPPFCEKWNLTFAVNNIKKDMIATLTLWEDYQSCFSSYCMYLFEFDSPSCNLGEGTFIPWKYEIEASPSKTLAINSSLCGKGRGHELLLGKFNFEARPNQTILVFKNVSIGYYCIWVVPVFLDGSVNHDYWPRASKPIIVKETGVNTNTEGNKEDGNTEFSTKVIVAISFLLFFTAFALWSCSVHIGRSKAKANKVSSIENEEDENEPFLTRPVDQVYLFHSHDDNSTKLEVCELKNRLQNGAPFHVITLKDLMIDFGENSNAPISNILECGCSGMGRYCESNKKFIIVISEKVLRDIDEGSFNWVSNEDKAFYMVFDFISNNWRKAYCHLFLVAFNENIFEDRRFKKMALKNIASHYAIPACSERLRFRLGLSA